MRKLTTQDFIVRARAVHGDRYGYDFSVYRGNHTKLMIHCPEHGIFEQTPGNHVNIKQGCPCCSGNKKHTNESFITRAREVHGEQYDYSLVDYVSAHQKIVIRCPTHGMFEQKPGNHLRGNGCPSCADKKMTTEEFIQKAKQIHGDSYRYAFSVYQSTHEKVMIHCPEHGDFEQSPSNHLRGNGCPSCMSCGFDRTKPASLYVLRSECGQYMKIGITNKPEQRHSQLSRATPFSFKRIEMVEGNGEFISNLEKQLLAKYQPAEFTELFDGSTEWRLWDSEIVNQIKQSNSQMETVLCVRNH